MYQTLEPGVLKEKVVWLCFEIRTNKLQTLDAKIVFCLDMHEWSSASISQVIFVSVKIKMNASPRINCPSIKSCILGDISIQNDKSIICRSTNRNLIYTRTWTRWNQTITSTQIKIQMSSVPVALLYELGVLARRQWKFVQSTLLSLQ